MSELLPSESDVESEQNGELRTLWLDSDEAGDLLSSLASDTARAILTALHEDPATASEIATRVDTSLQNARHHLGNLEEAGLVRVADTRYSEKGREMKVYAPSEDPMVVFVGREERRKGFVDSLRQLVPVATLLALVSVLVHWLVTPGTGSQFGGDLPRVGDSLGGAGGGLLGVPAGLVFFAGGLLVLTLIAAWQYRLSRRTGHANVR